MSTGRILTRDQRAILCSLVEEFVPIETTLNEAIDILNIKFKVCVYVHPLIIDQNTVKWIGRWMKYSNPIRWKYIYRRYDDPEDAKSAALSSALQQIEADCCN